MSMSETCPDCNGTGIHYKRNGKRVACERCSGTGVISQWLLNEEDR